MQTLQKLIEDAWDNQIFNSEAVSKSVEKVISMLDEGKLRVAEKTDKGWVVNQWIKKAVLLYFPYSKMTIYDLSPMEFYDKIPLKNNYAKKNVRVIPGAIARYGCYIAPNVVLMPSFTNIGAYIDNNTMIDTWATVGSCAQIGKNVHISGGVGIGGVLEPIQAAPVIIEDYCFIGSRCIIVEGAHIGEQAVLGANVTITGSSKIIDVTKSNPVEYTGYVPPNSVVIPGSYNKKFNAGEFQVSCALIIGKRKESTNKKTSLNDSLRDFNVAI